MQFSLATIAAVAGLAAAAPHAHQQFHSKKGADLMSDITSFLSGLGVKLPVNSESNNGKTWVGNDGQVVHTIQNLASEPVTFLVWGVQGSWVNAVPPQVAKVIQPGQNLTISHAMGSGWTPNTGGFAAIYPDTKLVNGQVSNIWGEFSFTNDLYSSSTYDVSMEVNMNGHGMTIEGPKCTSDATRCVFKCKDASVTTCGEAGSYDLYNCDAGSQPGASKGEFLGQASGGCQGISNEGVTQLLTTLH